ncbi:hypothetical protein L9F63_004190 [Diploptera punctata]|uniref:5'-Nucleotidase C-terminal domain-containing protein n=1 Tax=Diploptera punctata TaxID=6984 RepID=A0AAD7ZGL4_DIPPU|nr:hypothetical protein L9F63_004190 [Diploptera punctata]
MWCENGTRLAVFPAALFQGNNTLLQGNITAKALYDLLSEDSFLYTVTLTAVQLTEMLTISLNSKLESNTTDFLHVSYLLDVEYNKTADNFVNVISIKTVVDDSNSMKLVSIDLNNNKTFYNVLVPYKLLKMDNYKKLFAGLNESMIMYHNVTVIQAVIKTINNTGFLTLPIVGIRQQEIESPENEVLPECSSDEGTTILITLVVTVIVLGACYGIWWYIFKRRRGRSGSTMAMMNLQYSDG